MKISRSWLQRYFEKPLPNAAELADALTFHAFEIESVENDILDVKITANRGHDCLSHRGIAKELSAILQLPLKNDLLRGEASLNPHIDSVAVSIREPGLCSRYIACYVANVKVGPSPAWLRDLLESIGQKSINNIVDATNFVMFDLGQPLHAFDAAKLRKGQADRDMEDSYAISVRLARPHERLVALDEKEYQLDETMLVIADELADVPIGIAGVKGGKPAGITEATSDIILESANFNGISVRKTAQKLKLRTDASSRFEQVISPELAPFGMRAVIDLIREIAGGEVVGVADCYPRVSQQKTVTVTTERVNAILGSSFADADVAEAFTRLDLEFTKEGDRFVVEPPFERLDVRIPEDLAEEVGRLFGYDSIPGVGLAALGQKPAINPIYLAAEEKREALVAQGYSEVCTSMFVETGERVIANKIDGVRPYLRTSLVGGLKDALEKNKRNKELLGLAEVKLFEIGTVWKGGKELFMLGLADNAGVREEALQPSANLSAYPELPLSTAASYRPFSKYPFIVRDIALWVPQQTKPEAVLDTIRSHAGELLVKSDLFDTFEKGEQTSLAFRLVFQSFDRTLTDFDANERMAGISSGLQERGYTIR
jgi:phenylalanyl-tRNA synthetase beta chain